MDKPTVVIPPPVPEFTTNYPVLFAGVTIICFVAILLWLSKYLDPTGGPLTISLTLLLVFGAAVIFAMRYTIPQDAETGTLIGTLVLAIGTVVSYWLTHRN